jgi:arabinogalactan oligomer/maltooligosaccharide transport system permease protein
MAGKKQKSSVNHPLDFGFSTAFIKGNAVTKLSAVVFGLGNILNRQIIRGFLYLALEFAYISFMLSYGFQAIQNIFTLGTNAQVEVFNEKKQIYEYVVGDNSMLFLLYGVMTIFVTLLFIVILTSSVRSAYGTQIRKELGKPVPTFFDDLKSLLHEKLHNTLLFVPIIGVVCFTILPLFFNILIAFTNFDRDHQPPGNLFDWVGLATFRTMFRSGGILAKTFWPVFQWTIIWAVCATFSCYILGMLLAIVINRDGTRFKGFWRFMFVLSIAVPQFVSLLAMSTIFNASGPMNVLLKNLHIIGAGTTIPFLTNPLLAKITILVVNLWIGIPYTMLTTTGILSNIPRDLYEAAKVDGANSFVTFFKITLPYMLFITAPTLITAFVGNINNFNVIFLLTGGGPATVEYYSAGKTDLLVTWLYKLSLTNKDYNYASVVGLVIFVIFATLSLITYRQTRTYKDEEAFQ